MTQHYVRFDHPCLHDGVLTAIVLPDSAGLQPPDLMAWCRALPGRQATRRAPAHGHRRAAANGRTICASNGRKTRRYAWCGMARNR